MLMAAASVALLVAATLIACLLPGAARWQLLSLGLLAWGMCVATVAVAGVFVGDLSGPTLFLLVHVARRRRIIFGGATIPACGCR